MKITKFNRLKSAIISLGASPTVVVIEKTLLGKGIPVNKNSEHIVIGDNAIYHIEPSGILTKVVIHIVDKNISSRYATNIREKVISKDFENTELINDIHKYHITKCKTIERAEEEGWRKDKYRMSRRKDGTFFYRYIQNNAVYIEKEDQKLNLCKNCLKILNGNLNKNYNISNFNLNSFLNSKIDIPKKLNQSGQYDDLCVPNLYKADWAEISKKYRTLVKFQCENPDCPSPDLSKKDLHRYLHTHHVSMDKSNNNYSNLKAYCIYCHAQQPNHEQLKKTIDYKSYISYLKHEGLI